MSAQVEVAPSEAQALGASPATTIVNTPSQSRAASLKHSDRKSADVARNSHSRSASLADANAAEIEAGTPPVRSKDRAPVFVVALCLFQSLAGLLFGWESGEISSLLLMSDYQRRFGEPDAAAASGFALPSTRQSLIVSFLGLGALFGSLLSGVLSGKFGIKVTYLFSLAIFMIGIAVQVSCQEQWGQMLAGRFIAGYGVGALSMLAPLYQAECSPKHLRGMITSTYQLAATIGIFLANVVNYNMQDVTGPLSWRLTISLQLIWGGITFIGTIFGPELPRYFIQRGNVDQARINLAKLRDLDVEDPELEAEVQQMVKRNEAENAAGDFGYLDCFRSEGRLRLRTLIGIMIQAGQQWSGVNFFFSFGTGFFLNAGISDAFLVQVILGAVNVGSTLPGLWAVEKLGRRQTLFIGAGIMFTGQVVTGALGTAYPQGEVAGKLIIFFSCLFIFGFASSWGPLGWVVAAEQFPLRASSYCVAFATASNWLNNFVLAMITPYVQNQGYGNLQAKITFIWAAAIALFTVLIFLLVPETQGLSLVQIDELYLSRVPAWKSSKWVPFGGAASKRTAKEGSLKLGNSEKRNENVAARDLSGDDDE